MLTFQALALFVYALSRDVLLAVGAAALVFFTRSAEYGAIYPLFLLGTEHTYGVIGLSLGVLSSGSSAPVGIAPARFLLGVGAVAFIPRLGSWTGASSRLPCSRTSAACAPNFVRRCRGFLRAAASRSSAC